ncbi:uncharacterized protein TNCV_767281 [Trichonephila clavipes]|nr:uncharacterized protein TNCV_767281 [Trichonephila clavipes]
MYPGGLLPHKIRLLVIKEPIHPILKNISFVIKEYIGRSYHRISLIKPKGSPSYRALNTCNYSPLKRVPISKRVPRRNFDAGPPKSVSAIVHRTFAEQRTEATSNNCDIGKRTISPSYRAVGSLVVRASDSRPEGLGSMLDVTKYPPSAHGFTCRNCGGGDRGRVAIYRPFGEVSLSLNRTVTCMVLKANDRRTSCPCHDEFRGPRSDYVRQTPCILNRCRSIYARTIGDGRNS